MRSMMMVSRSCVSVSFEVRSGEILGVAGVSGNGQRAIAEAIAGLQRLSPAGRFLLKVRM